MKLLILLGMLALVNTQVFGAQCRIISAKKAKEAYRILKKAQKKQKIFVIDQYCEACFDKKPAPIVVDSLRYFQLSPAMAQILVNSKAIDMAYIYVEGTNLAYKVGCKTIAVSQNLD